MKNKLLQGTMVLLCSSVVLRCLGFVYQILVVRIAGTESLGILNMTMPFYMLLVVVATMGMPIAITKLTAQYAASHGQAVIAQMMRTAFGLVLILSVVCLIAACVVMPEVFALLNTEQRVQQCFLVLIPGIIIVPFCSVMRGYFQGMQQMVYPSIGQIIEQLIRVFCGIGLILWVSPKDVLSLAMSLGCAAMLGEAGGCAFLAVLYLRNRRKALAGIRYSKITGSKEWLKPLLSLGLPVTGTRLTSTVDMAIEASIVPFCLIASGYTISQAASIYGQFSGVAVSLLTIPTVLTGALGCLTTHVMQIVAFAVEQEKSPTNMATPATPPVTDVAQQEILLNISSETTVTQIAKTAVAQQEQLNTHSLKLWWSVKIHTTMNVQSVAKERKKKLTHLTTPATQTAKCAVQQEKSSTSMTTPATSIATSATLTEKLNTPSAMTVIHLAISVA